MKDRWIVQADEAGLRLDKYLASAARLGSRGRAASALERGKVFLNDAELVPADTARRLDAGDTIRIWMDRPGSSRKRTHRGPREGELRIVYEDDAIVVVDKPAGLLTVPLPRREEAPSVEEMLAVHLRSKRGRRPCVVHRIDRDTSGLVMFATRPEAQARLKEQFRRHTAGRVYLAVVYGIPEPAEGLWRDYLVWDDEALIQKATHPADPRASDARCEYAVLERFDGASLIQVTLITGRRNQIRLQARLRGHTLVGEQRYTFGPEHLRPIEFPRQALHAWRLAVSHPSGGRPMQFEAPLADDMDELVRRLRQ
jgi:23S rRNA pseudouridine1911/1915/1917 synthase